MHPLTIDADRLWTTIQDTAVFGAIDGGGLCRPALGEADRLVRDWFAGQAKSIGCSVEVDDVGNMFARRSGSRSDLDPIAIGSHLDTQPTGGRFDGVLGVLAGLEILRTMSDAGFVTNAPIEVVNWTNEEGSRFAPAMLASGVFAGVFSRDFAWLRVDPAGDSFGEQLERIGYRGTRKAGDHRFAATFELHIEQGPILDREGIPIGIVTGVQGAQWFDVRLTGRTGHTGATPMVSRRNALVGAARVVTMVDSIAAAHGPSGTATVGSLDVAPNARNVIPGEVLLTIDLRHPEAQMMSVMAGDMRRELVEIAAELGLHHELTMVLDSPPLAFDPLLIDMVEQGAALAGLEHRRIVSGAAHDSVYLARIAPTTMIFVPCKDGVSHNVEEFASPKHCAGGAQVLLNTVLAYDAFMADGLHRK